jgi:glycosyltransferase involved in cell wall biosynthesis
MYMNIMPITSTKKTSCRETFLVFVTYEYPYGLSETFIETEIKYLANAFDRVLIVPSRAFFSKKWPKNKIDHKRVVPENCEIILPSKDSINVYFLVLKAIFKLASHVRIGVPQGGRILRVAQEILRESVKAALFFSRGETLFRAGHNIQVIYSYWKSPAAVALCLLNENNKHRFPLVTRCHGGDLYYNLPELPSRPYDFFVSERFNFIAPISEHGGQHLVEHDFEKNKIKVSRLGVRLPINTSRQSEDGIWRIVSCSNIIPVKRVQLIAATLARLDHPFIWTHFGDGFERNKLDEIIIKFPAFGSANLPGRLPNNQVVGFYQTEPVDLFINVSTSEGVPVSIMEALSYGIPCLATDVGGTSELVDSSVGRLLPVDADEHDIASIITSELSDQSAWSKKREQARQRAVLICDADVNYTNFAAFLHETITSLSPKMKVSDPV